MVTRDTDSEATPDGARVFFVAFRTAEGGVGVQIDPDAIVGPSEAGVLLADFARHLALALAETGQVETPEDALEEMLDLFDAELDNPTDAPEGGLAN